MIISVNNQALILFASVYGGLILGLFFDFYRLIRNAFRFSKIVTFIGDISFWIIGLTVSLVIIYRSSSGLVRFYQILGFALGMTVYLKILSRYVVKLLYFFLRCLRNFMYTVLRIGKVPWVVLSNLLWKPYDRSKTWLSKLFIKMSDETRRYMEILRKKK
jgi:spore cortex biosynthesis protein YabQ